METEDDIYLLTNYFLKSQGEGEQALEEGEKGAKDEEMMEEKEDKDEATGGIDEGGKKDDEGSVVMSVDEKASDSSSVKAHLSGNKVVLLTVVWVKPLPRFFTVENWTQTKFAAFDLIWFKKRMQRALTNENKDILPTANQVQNQKQWRTHSRDFSRVFHMSPAVFCFAYSFIYWLIYNVFQLFH